MVIKFCSLSHHCYTHVVYRKIHICTDDLCSHLQHLMTSSDCNSSYCITSLPPPILCCDVVMMDESCADTYSIICHRNMMHDAVILRSINPFMEETISNSFIFFYLCSKCQKVSKIAQSSGAADIL